MNSSGYATKDDLQIVKNDLQAALQKTEKRLEERLGKRIDDAIKGAVESMASVFADGMQMISGRFDKVETRLDTLEEKVDDLQTIVIKNG